MSRSLSVEIDPVDQPNAMDELDRRSWSMLGIRVSGRSVTKLWDRTSQLERKYLYVPTFGIVEWVVLHWWNLLNETSPTGNLPPTSTPHLGWIRRHCLKCADSSSLLPSLYVFSDGRDTELIWQADSVEVPSDPSLEFVESGRDRVDRASVESALTEFVNGVLSRVKGAADERLDAVAGTWSTILSASSSEADFCTVVGRLGLDPYQLAEVPEALLDFIEREIDNPHRPILKDLTETSEPNEVMEQLQWVRRTTSELALGAGCPDPSWRDVQGAAAVAANEGYRLANLTRLRAGLSPVDPVESVTDFARHGVGISLHTSDSNHLSGKHVQALVGWSRDGSVTLAGPRPPRSDSQRFLESRGLYQAMFGCDQSERLLTRAYTWDQQSSRAFAAELLAPRAALVARVKGTADEDDLAKLSEDFGVSRRVIEHQLTNAGVAILGSDF